MSAEITCLVFSRAIDTILKRALKSMKASPKVLQLYDVSQFTLSCFVIMFNWFYLPQNMQEKYRQWITKMANMEDDLVLALRLIRDKKLFYGVEGENSALLENISQKYGFPKEFGNTAKVYIKNSVFFFFF